MCPPVFPLRFALSLACALAIRAPASDPAPLEFKKPVITSDLGGRDLGFLTKANEQGVIMHYVSELAKTKGESAGVRELGERFAAGQEEETNHLIELTAGKGLNFKAQTPPAIKKIHTRLNPLTGAAFDKACVAELTALARDIVANYEAGAQSKDPEIKTFADEGLTHAREDLEAARGLAGK
jgi:predicted outer membrane protein